MKDSVVCNYDSILDIETLTQSMSSDSERLSLDEDEEELVRLLGELEEAKKSAELKENESPKCSSQASPAYEDTIVPELNKPRAEYLDIQDEFEMSQICFDSDPFVALDDAFEAEAKRFEKGRQRKQRRRRCFTFFNECVSKLD